MFKLVAAIAAAVCASAAFAQAPAPAGLQLTPVEYVVPSDRWHRYDRYRLERERHGYFRHHDASYVHWMRERARHERYAEYRRHHERYVRWERHHHHRYIG
jgi:hypothetical protein